MALALRGHASVRRLTATLGLRGGGSTNGVKSGQGEFGPFLLGAVLAGHRVHAQTPFDQQALPWLHPVLQILRQVAPTHNFELTRGVIGAQAVKPHLHFGDRGLVVLGVAKGGCLHHIDFEHAVIHRRPVR